MNGAEQLEGEVRRSVAGDAWFGPSAREVLAGVDASMARASVPGANHTIWEIVRHIAVWARYVAYRLDGGEPRDPEEGNWPEVGETDEAAWARELDELGGAYERVAVALGRVTDAELDAVTESTPRDEAGEPVTLRRTVEGVAQHAAYHTGQITTLKQVGTAWR